MNRLDRMVVGGARYAAPGWRRAARSVAAAGLSVDPRLVGIAVAPRPRSGSDAGRRAYRIGKRALDVVAVLAALPFVLPILAVCAVAVRIDSKGAPFFSQPRTGRGGRRFKMYKLRTMVHNAGELKEKYLHLNELSWPDFKITNDELPQLFNVLTGDMSLVGPRPTSFSADTYSLWHTARLDVKPGLTGLWQVSGRNEIDFDERLRLDIAYIRRRSFTLDLLILFRTFSAVWYGRGAS